MPPVFAPNETMVESVVTEFEHMPRLPFGQAEEAMLHGFLSAANHRGCDLVVATDGAVPGIPALLDDGLLVVRSRNLGYQFALVHVEDGRGLFGGRRTAVRIYVSRTNSQKYGVFGQARRLRAALSSIERLYWDAARSHLP